MDGPEISESSFESSPAATPRLSAPVSPPPGLTGTTRRAPWRSPEIVAKAIRYQLRAETRMGEILRAMKERGERRDVGRVDGSKREPLKSASRRRNPPAHSSSRRLAPAVLEKAIVAADRRSPSLPPPVIAPTEPPPPLRRRGRRAS